MKTTEKYGFNPFLSISNQLRKQMTGKINIRFKKLYTLLLSVMSALMVSAQVSLEYSTSPGILEAAYTGNTYSIITQAPDAKAIAFNDDGTQMYIATGSGTAFVVVHNLTIPYDITTASTAGFNFNPSPQEPNPGAIAWSADGTQFYVGGFTTSTIFSYNVTTPFDLTTASINNSFLQSQDVSIEGLAFNNDGSKMYILGQNNDAVFEYNLSTPFDVSTAVFSTSFIVSAQDVSVVDLAFNANGSKMYVLGNIGNQIYEYGLATNFDVSTASFLDSFSVSGQDTDFSGGMTFGNQGAHVYVIGKDNDLVFDYSMGAAFSEFTTFNGQVDGNIIITINGDTFTNAGGGLSSPTHYTIDNLPSGLSSFMDVAPDGASATLKLMGTADDNTNADDVNNLQFTFTDNAFTSTLATNVSNATGASSNLGIDFEDNTRLSLSFTGNTVDDSGNGNNATVGDGVTGTTFPTLTTDRFGRINQAYSFDGLDDYMTSPQTWVTNTPFSISTWVFWDGDNGNFQEILSWWDVSQGSKPYLGVSATTGEIRFGDSYGSTGAFMPVGQWVHLVATYDWDGISKIYLNNQLVSVSGTGLSNDFINGSLEIGKQRSGTEYWDGKIDDITFYTYPLKESEIQNLYEFNGWPIVADVPLDGNASDISGNGHDGTITGTIATTDRFGNATSALTFDGVDDFIFLNNTTILGDDNFSVEFWTRFDSYHQGSFVSANNIGSLDGWAIVPENDGNIYFWIGNGGASDFITSNAAVLSSWNHVVAVKEGSDIRLYINGNLESTGTTLRTVNADILVHLGRRYNDVSQNFLNGDLDGVRIYRTALQDQDVVEKYQEFGWPLNNSGILLAQYDFSGNMDDNSGNGLNGVQVLATPTSDRFGNLNSAYNFDGSTSYNTIPTDPVFQFGTSQDFSISGWFRSTNLNDSRIIQKYFNGTGFRLWLLGDGTVSFDLAEVGSGKFVSSLSGYNDGNWHHFVVQADRDTYLSVHIDGVQDNLISNFTTDKNIDTGDDIYIGVESISPSNSTLSNFFQGDLDDIVFYTSTLTDSDILGLYNRTSPNVNAPSPFAEQVDPTTVRVYWNNDITSNGYSLFQSTDGGSSFTLVDNTIQNTENIYDVAVVTGTSYIFELEVSNASSTASGFSNEVSVETVTTPPYDINPPSFTLDDAITITVYPDRTYPPGQLENANKIYLHSGLIEAGQGLENQGGWTAAPGNTFVDDNGVGLMTDNGDGSWSITINDQRSYYGVDGTFTASQLAFLFRNENGTLVGKGPIDFVNNTQDIFVDYITVGNPGIFTAALSQTSMIITWNDVADELGYRIYRSTDDVSFTEIASLGPDVTEFTDTGLTSNSLYFYYVEAYDASSASATGSVGNYTFSDGLSTRFDDFGTFGSGGFEYGRSVEVDVDGNFYYYGVFTDDIDIDGTILTATGQGVYLAKFNNSGSLIWAKAFDSFEPTNSAGFMFGQVVTVDATGDVYISGQFSGNYGGITTNQILDESSNFQSYVSNAFVTKLDPNGNEIWTRVLNSTGYSSANDIVFDGTGNLYVVGEWNGDATFAATAMTGGGPFLLKYDTNGNENWVRVGVQSNFDDTGFGLGAATDGSSIYITGATRSDTDFGGTIITDLGGGEIFVVKYDQNGNVIWVREAGGDDLDVGFDIVLDINNDPYITGYFNSGTLTSGGVTLTNTSAGESDIFLIKFDQTGAPQWGRQYGTGLGDFAFNIATDGDNLYVTGLKSKDPASFDGVAADNGTFYLLSVDSFGGVNWVDIVEGSVRGRDMDYDNGLLYIPGRFEYAANVGGSIFTSNNNSSDAFLGRMQVQPSFSNGLVGYYRFDGGQVFDDSGNGYDGTLVGINTPFPYMDRNGDQSSSLFFPDDPNSFIDINHGDVWDFSGEMTWNLWVNPTNFPQGVLQDLIFASTTTPTPQVLRIDDTGSVSFSHDDVNNINVVEVGGTINPNEWSMLTVTIDAVNNLRIYINGAITLETGISRVASFITSNVLIGAGNANGRIDDLRFYEIALSDTEVQDIYTSERPTGRIAYFPFDGGSLFNENGDGYDLSEKDINNQFAPGSIATITDRNGDPNSAYALDNSGQFLELFHNFEWDFNHELTVNAWINMNALPINNGINWDVVTEDTQGGRMIVDGDGSLIYHWCNGVDCPVESSPPGVITPGIWQMVTYTLDRNNDLKLYVDGKLVHTGNNIARNDYQGNHFWIGSNELDGTDDRYFDGAIDEVSVWERTLSGPELLELFGGQGDLVAYYPFNGNASDESGNGWDGALISNPPATTDRFGNANSAFNFDGGVQYMQAPKAITIAQDYTWTAWFRTTGGGTIATITSDDGNWPIGGRNLYVGGGNLVFDASNIGEVRTTNTYNDGAWHHVALTASMDPGGFDLVSIYVDGEFQVSRGDWEIDQDNDDGFIFRAGFTSNTFPTPTYFSGDLDDITVYSKALNSDEIAEVYNSEGGFAKRLIAYWPFNGNAVDVTGNGNDGNVNGPVLGTDRLGNTNSSYVFNSQGATINVFDNGSLEPQNAISVAAWVNLQNAEIGSILSKQFNTDGNPPFNSYTLNGHGSATGTDNRFVFGVNTVNGEVFVEDPDFYNFNQWYLVIGVYDGADVIIYVDGVEKARQALDGLIDYTDAEIVFGDIIGGTNFFSGSIDEARIFNYALSQTEISDLYNSESPNTQPLEPTNLTARVLSSSVVELMWDDNAFNETNYRVDWFSGGTFVNGLDVGPNTTFARITGLSTDVTYDFEVYAQNLTSSSFIATATATPVDLQPFVSVTPSPFTLDEPGGITITVDINTLYPPGELVGANKVYIHSGLVPPGSENQGGWVEAPGNIFTSDNGIGEMTDNLDGTYSITISDLRGYYGVDASYQAAQIGMIFRNEDGSSVGLGAFDEGNNTSDIFINVFDPGLVTPPDNESLVVSDQGELVLFDPDAFNPSVYSLSGPFTIEMWVNVNSSNTTAFEETFFARGDDFDGIDAWGFSLAGGVWNFEVYDPTNGFYEFAETIDPWVADTWTHLAGVWDGTEMRLYVNGELKGTNAYAGSLYQPASDPFIDVGRGDLNVIVNELRIWNTILPENAIRNNLSIELSGTEVGLVGYWPMDVINNDGTNDFTPDLTFGNDLIISGIVELPTSPDLEISSTSTASTDKSVYTQQETITVNYTLDNNGDGPADVSEQIVTGFALTEDLVIGAEDFLFEVDEGTFIDVGESISRNAFLDLTIHSGIPDGNYNLIIIADVYDIVSESNEDNNLNTDIAVTISADQSPPTVSLNSLPGSSPIDNISITIIADDDAGPPEVRYYVRPALASGTGRESIATYISGTQYSGQIQASDFDNQGVSIYAIATDASGKSASTDTVTIVTEPSTPPTVTSLPQGTSVQDYDIIGWPFQNAPVSSVLSGLGERTEETWRLFSYNSSQDRYIDNVSNLVPGVGYWLINNSGVSSISLDNVSVLPVDESRPFTLTLSQGIHLIGNPYQFRLDWDAVLAHNEPLGVRDGDVSTLVIYNNGYGQTSSLARFKGAFVKVNTGSVSLEIPFSALSGSGREGDDFAQPRQSIYDNGGWEVMMDMQADNGWRYGVSGFGEYEKAEEGMDNFDMTGLPHFDEYLAATFLDDGLQNITKSITNVKENNVWTFEVQSHEKRSTGMTITFNGTPGLEGDQRIVLFDMQTGKMEEIHNRMVYSFSYSPGYTFKVIKGTDEFIEDQARVSSVIVNSIYPNPNRGELNIPMLLPQTEDNLYGLEVSLKDLSGRVVHRMVPLSLNGGNHILKFDIGEKVKTNGIYLLSITINQAGREPITRFEKIFLVK